MNALAFEYSAVDRAGREQRGVTRAMSRETAYRQVVAMGLTPVSLRPAGATRRARSRPVGHKELAQFTHQLAVFIDSRIPLSEALAIIGEQETNDRFRRVLTDVASRVHAGHQLSAAMDAHRGLFGEVYIESVRAAEYSGSMSSILAHLADMLERMDETRRQVKGALLYPLIVVGTLGLAVSFLVTFVVPRFAAMFRARGVELPVLTRMLMSVGESARTYWWAWLPGIVAAIWCFRIMVRSPRTRGPIDRALHRVPVLRDVLRGVALSRFARVLGLSLSSGLGLIESLLMSGRASGRPMLEADIRRLTDQVRVGGRLSDILPACSYMPVFARRMLSAGEHAGELPKMCETVARQYERETGQLTKNLGTIIEPILVVLIAAIVLVVALAIFLPMWDMVKLMG